MLKKLSVFIFVLGLAPVLHANVPIASGSHSLVSGVQWDQSWSTVERDSRETKSRNSYIGANISYFYSLSDYFALGARLSNGTLRQNSAGTELEYGLYSLSALFRGHIGINKYQYIVPEGYFGLGAGRESAGINSFTGDDNHFGLSGGFGLRLGNAFDFKDGMRYLAEFGVAYHGHHLRKDGTKFEARQFVMNMLIGTVF